VVGVAGVADDFVGSLTALYAVEDDRLSGGVHEVAEGGAFLSETSLERPRGHVKRHGDGFDPAVSLGKEPLDAVANAVEKAIVLELRVKPGRHAAQLAMKQLVAMREAQVPRIVADEQGAAILSEKDRSPERACVFRHVAAIGVLEVDFFQHERIIGGKPKELHQDRCDELDLMRQHGELVLDLVDVKRMVSGVLPEGEDATVREKLLKANARRDPIAERLRAQKQQEDEMVRPRLPLFGGAQAKKTIAAFV